MNILLTSAGRRGYLVDYFKNALNGDGLVHVSNSVSAPSFCHADKSVISPLIYDEEYIPFLIDYCVENEIELVISLFDVDLMILAKNKATFEEKGIRVLVSDEQVIDICNDKWNTYRFCVENGFACPKTYIDMDEVKRALSEGTISFPIIVKPRWGMGSIGIFEAENLQELEVFRDKVRRAALGSYLKYESAADIDRCVVFQEKIQGQEYGLDVIHDFSGKHMNTIVRKKEAMRAGETDSARVLDDKRIAEFGKLVGERLGHIGNLDMDIFVTDDAIYVLELNARFGGGYPFSHFAGVDLPSAIIKWMNGEALSDELLVKEYGRLIQKDITLIAVD